MLAGCAIIRTRDGVEEVAVFLALGAAVALSLPAGQMPPSFPYDCRSGRSGLWVNVGEARAAYGRRSVEVIEAALAGDASRLAAIVDPRTQFSYVRGDAGFSTIKRGAEAAIEFVSHARPVAYEFATEFPGPISREPCGPATARLLVKSAGDGRAYDLTFRYVDGILMEVTGAEVILSEGRFGGGTEPPR
jgi:hypothetical protein